MDAIMNAESSINSYRMALHALEHLPDRCASDVGELAKRIGADKLELVTWSRADLAFARLLAAKLA
ncbi:MAG: hypothetical protein ABW110_20430 [Steroidobacteraceae bacterium]